MRPAALSSQSMAQGYLFPALSLAWRLSVSHQSCAEIYGLFFPLDQISVTNCTVADKALQKRGLKGLILCYPNYLIILITAAN